MDSPFKEYTVATAIIIVVTCVAEYLISDSWMDTFLAAVIMTCCYTCLVMGMYFFLEGKGFKNVNGVDWQSMTEQQCRNLVSYMGVFFMAASIILMYAVALLMSYLFLGIFLIIFGTVLFIIPMALKEKGKNHPFKQRSRGTKVAVFAVVSVLAIVPCFYFMNVENNEEAVTVEFGEKTFHIQAPMVDLTFSYDDISDIGLDPDFDKGTRKWGYSTTVVCSGKFSNLVFGDYTLASYTKVKSCVFFTCNGEYYAFNQFTDESTSDAYDFLINKK